MAFVVGLLALVTGEKNGDIAPCKEIQILESGKVLLVESRILEISLVETRILGIGIQNTVQGIWIKLSTGFQNQKFHWKKIQNPEPKTWLDSFTWSNMINKQVYFNK